MKTTTNYYERLQDIKDEVLRTIEGTLVVGERGQISVKINNEIFTSVGYSFPTRDYMLYTDDDTERYLEDLETIELLEVLEQLEER